MEGTPLKAYHKARALQSFHKKYSASLYSHRHTQPHAWLCTMYVQHNYLRNRTCHSNFLYKSTSIHTNKEQKLNLK